jgi:hypothetical protein
MAGRGYVVLDTDVSSHLIRGRLPERARSLLVGRTMAVTFVTVGELTKWTRLRSWGPRRLDEVTSWLGAVVLLPSGREVAERWGDLQAAAQLRGRPRPANDTWIAACCLVHDVELATLNTKDFADFAEHDGLRLTLTAREEP